MLQRLHYGWLIAVVCCLIWVATQAQSALDTTSTGDGSFAAPGENNPATQTTTPGELPAEAVAVPRTPLQELLDAAHHPLLLMPDFSRHQTVIQALYQANGEQLLWFDGDAPKPAVTSVLDLLEQAPTHGLNVKDYDTALFRREWQTLQQAGGVASAAQRLNLDVAMTIAVVRFLSDVHHGRVNPRRLKFSLGEKAALLDLVPLLRAAIDAGTVAQLAAQVEPPYSLYRNLKTALARYRHMADSVPQPRFSFKEALRPGAHDKQIALLREFLRRTGDLPNAAAQIDKKEQSIYHGALIEAVKSFQFRHGLLADGVIGAQTVEALNTPWATRVRQIELSLERLRWIPPIDEHSPFVAVNIPSFYLWAFDSLQHETQPSLTMKVVVGEAMDKQTPVFMAEMRYLDFRPYWNVPPSIIKKEILPKFYSNPGYFASHDMEIVEAIGPNAKPLPMSGANIERLRQGQLKLRQRPGKKNPLGAVKFIFPNDNDIYFHDTPTQKHFSRSRRDFSHGCIRLEQPQDLATFVLKDHEGWDRSAITQAMQQDKTRRVFLKKPLPVIIFYTTALANDKGLVFFYEDIYGHDQALDVALLNRHFSKKPKKPETSAPQLAANQEAPLSGKNP